MLGCVLSNGTSTVGKCSGGYVMNFGFYWNPYQSGTCIESVRRTAIK